ncbi:MAG: hypothetical protein HRU19_11300 [Pseudobacteriovorax sp.]|nr:hypothetical protein [Pseudobacteriovorax sp.]
MKIKYLIPLTSLGLLSACGSTPENVDVFNDTARDAYYETFQSSDAEKQVWLDLSNFYGFAVPDDAETVSISGALATSPTLYGSIGTSGENTDYDGLLAGIAGDLVPKAVTSQCGGIVGITPANQALKAVSGTPGAAAAKYHYFQYKLKNADGTPEDATRTAIITIPDTGAGAGGPYPLTIYGHGSQTGLGYGEIYTVFDLLQEWTIIAAPTFPGEPLCAADYETSEGVCTGDNLLAAASSTQTGTDIWDNDVTEVIGLHNCLTSAVGGLPVPNLNADFTAGNGNFDIANDFTAKLKTVKATSDTSLPYTIFAGADRGALTVQLATARIGFYLQDAASESSLVTAYKTSISDTSTQIYPFPSAILNLGGNYSMTMGLNRVALHSAITNNTRFDALPGWATLRAGLFNQYRETTNEATTTEIAVEISKRDMVFMEQFVPIALRDWSNASPVADAAKGQALTLHPTQDLVVRYAQARIADGTRANIQLAVAANNAAAETDATKLPGYYHTVYAFQDPTVANWYDCKNGTSTEEAVVAACAASLDSAGGDETTWDGWTYLGIDTEANEFNHVSNTSFTSGSLVSATAAQAALIADATANGSDIYNTAVGCASPLNNDSINGATRSFAAPLFNRATDETAYSGAYNASGIATSTPPGVAFGFFVYHNICTDNNS